MTDFLDDLILTDLSSEQNKITMKLLNIDDSKCPAPPSIEDAKEILNRNHAFQDTVKQQIIEYAAAQQTVENFTQAVLCLVGPPGTGKTSLAKSVAESLGRELVYIPMPSITAAWELVGSSVGWQNANIGRILQCILDKNTYNLVICFDEIDKTPKTPGQYALPDSALLQLFDDNKSAFVDSYLKIPINLSRVVFMCTANQLETVNPALIDRCNVVNIDGYTRDEKRSLLKSHILPKLYTKYNIDTAELILTETAIEMLISIGDVVPGVRTLQKAAEAVFLRGNLLILQGQRSLIFNGNDVRAIVPDDIVHRRLGFCS